MLCWVVVDASDEVDRIKTSGMLPRDSHIILTGETDAAAQLLSRAVRAGTSVYVLTLRMSEGAFTKCFKEGVHNAWVSKQDMRVEVLSVCQTRVVAVEIP